MSSRVKSWNGYESTLNGAIDANTGTITVQSSDNLVADTFLIIDPDVPAIRDFVFVTNVADVVLTVRTPRPEEGSTGGVAHDHADGAVIRAVPVHQWLDLIFDDIEALEAFDANHAPGTDPHPQYLNEGEADGLYLPLDGAVPMAADMDMGGNQISNMGGGLANDDAATLLQVQTGDTDTLAAAQAYADALDHDHATPIASHASDAGAHHAKYTDGEAVAAMGVKSDLNDLNHDKYTDTEAAAAYAASASYAGLDARISALEGGAPPEAHTHVAADTTSGTFAVARIPDISASKVTAGSFPAGGHSFLGSLGVAGPFNANSSVDFNGVAVNAGGADLRINGNSVTRSA